MSLRKIKLLTSGESHGPAVTAILEGLPSGLPLSLQELQHQMLRRQRGFGRGGRMKIETDEVEITGGIRSGKTIGSPITIVVRNRDFQNWQTVMSIWEKADESKREVHRPRPGHADLAGGQKYGEHDLRNILERASARETVVRVAAGAICKQLLGNIGINIASHVLAIGPVESQTKDATWEQILRVQDSEKLRCVDADAEEKMVSMIEEAKNKKETLGGIFEVVATGIFPGLGSHVHWDRKLDGRIAQAMLSIPAVKGMTIGNAFSLSQKWGSEAHDEIFFEKGKGFFRKTNRSGGTEGGITTGQELRIQAALKPLSTLMKPLRSVDVVTKEPEDAVVERSDVTSVPAGGVVGEAMLALVLTDALLEKFASDSYAEFMTSVESYKKRLKEY
jgi:chorismate synthase